MMEALSETEFNDVEKYGFLMKKTSKGLWVNRFFATDRNCLHYWHEQKEFDEGQPSKEKYDISEVKLIEKQSTHGISMCFMNNSKFKLELKASQVVERNDWIDFLEAKRKLYSIDEFLSDIKLERISFKTTLFKAIMLLQEKDQNNWILNRLDESFEISTDESYSQQLRSDNNKLLLAACRCIHELIQSCVDCQEEMKSREPKTTAHCRNYIRRYADIVKGRIVLELLYLPGVEKKQFEDLGEKALCTALILTTQLEYLSDHFAFIPKEFFSTFDKTIFSTGDIISALLKLSVKRIDALFVNLLSFTPNQRGERILNLPNIFLEFLNLIHNDLTDEELYKLVIEKSITAQLLAFCDHLSMLSFDGYDEAALVQHILVCDQLYSTLSQVIIDIHARQVVTDPEEITAYTVIKTAALPSHYMTIPKAVLESIQLTTQQHAYVALLTSIHHVKTIKQYLMKDFFHEKRDGWVGGVLCTALTNSLIQWIRYMEERLPEIYHTTIRVEICKLTLIIYVQQLVSTFQQYGQSNTPNPLRAVTIPFTKTSIEQIEFDLNYFHRWMNIICKNPTDAIDEKSLMQILRSFVICAEANALHVFADSVLQMGIQHSLYLYDLFRFILKLRHDISSKTRKAILSICGEFMHQITITTTLTPDVLSGTIVTNRAQGIFDILFPCIGSQHITGSKWKMEHPTDITAIRLSVTLMVTETTNRAMDAKRNRHKQPAVLTLPSKPMKPLGGAESSSSKQSDTTSTTSAKNHLGHGNESILHAEDTPTVMRYPTLEEQDDAGLMTAATTAIATEVEVVLVDMPQDTMDNSKDNSESPTSTTATTATTTSTSSMKKHLAPIMHHKAPPSLPPSVPTVQRRATYISPPSSSTATSLFPSIPTELEDQHSSNEGSAMEAFPIATATVTTAVATAIVTAVVATPSVKIVKPPPPPPRPVTIAKTEPISDSIEVAPATPTTTTTTVTSDNLVAVTATAEGNAEPLTLSTSSSSSSSEKPKPPTKPTRRATTTSTITTPAASSESVNNNLSPQNALEQLLRSAQKQLANSIITKLDEEDEQQLQLQQT